MSTELDEAKRRFLQHMEEEGINAEIAQVEAIKAGKLLDTSGVYKGTNFKAQHFSLFALPTIIVYMQGIAPVTYPIASLQVAFLHSKVRKIRYSSLTPENFTADQIATIKAATKAVEEDRTRLFSDAYWHKHLVTDFASAGGTVTANATSKALAQEKLDKYNEAAVAFLLLHGIKTLSGTEYLERFTRRKKVMDPSAEFDW